MLNSRCRRLACSQAALNTVHQRPNPTTGTAPLAPSTNRLSRLGDSTPNGPPVFVPPRDISRATAKSVTEPPVSRVTNPRSCPNLRTNGANPQSPGLRAPHP
jgi:hypothetical protein